MARLWPGFLLGFGLLIGPANAAEPTFAQRVEKSAATAHFKLGNQYAAGSRRTAVRAAGGREKAHTIAK
jgi:hypothetical protein